MRHKDKSQLARDWQAQLQRTPVDVRQAVAALVAEHRAALADHFYTTMLDDPHANLFLSNEQVKQRLHPSMQRWLTSLFDVELDALDGLVDHQERVGEIHARVDIPVNLVLGGARHLKQALYREIARGLEDEVTRGHATIHVSDHIDMAMEVMSHAYSVASDRNARTEEAYRLFSLTQSLGSERERQRSALLDWENNLMYAVASRHLDEGLPRLASSEFGLWYHHKAAHAFEGAPEIQRISAAMARIDEQLLLELSSGDNDRQLTGLGDIRDASRSIQLLLNDLLERASGLEAGRDSLTRLLNRKFLPVVLNREIELARRSNKRFAVLMVDIDYFKTINDSHGHEAGDQVLQQMAGLLDRSTRGGDYVFRLGGEEFLIVLVDTDQEGSRLFAERLLQRVRQENFLLSGDTLINLTVSIGLTLHDGHPDQQRTLRRADEALYRAKHAGRDRVEIG